jgi:hypothetical protein
VRFLLDNCQVGIYLGYVGGSEHALVDVRKVYHLVESSRCRSGQRSQQGGQEVARAGLLIPADYPSRRVGADPVYLQYVRR